VAESPAEAVTDAVPTGRAVRKCVKNTPNYSHTHRGITSSQVTSSKIAFLVRTHQLNLSLLQSRCNTVRCRRARFV